MSALAPCKFMLDCSIEMKQDYRYFMWVMDVQLHPPYLVYILDASNFELPLITNSLSLIGLNMNHEMIIRLQEDNLCIYFTSLSYVQLQCCCVVFLFSFFFFFLILWMLFLNFFFFFFFLNSLNAFYFISASRYWDNIWRVGG